MQLIALVSVFLLVTTSTLAAPVPFAEPVFGFGNNRNGGGIGAADAANAANAANANSGKGTGKGSGNGNGGTPSSSEISAAVTAWEADTSIVSNFLNTGPSLTGAQFKQAATVALNAENDELTHKAVLDAAFGNQQTVTQANNVLVTKGTFQDVVDLLQQMSTQGVSAVEDIDKINANRCVNVLPSIDAYFAAAGTNEKAVRPTACDDDSVVDSNTASGNQGGGSQAGTAGTTGGNNGNTGNTGNAGNTGQTGQNAGTTNTGNGFGGGRGKGQRFGKRNH